MLAWKAAATSGSSSIIRLPFSATSALRSSICCLTQKEKVSPSTEYATLTIHCLGSFFISCSTG